MLYSGLKCSRLQPGEGPSRGHSVITNLCVDLRLQLQSWSPGVCKWSAKDVRTDDTRVNTIFALIDIFQCQLEKSFIKIATNNGSLNATSTFKTPPTLPKSLAHVHSLDEDFLRGTVTTTALNQALLCADADHKAFPLIMTIFSLFYTIFYFTCIVNGLQNRSYSGVLV